MAVIILTQLQKNVLVFLPKDQIFMKPFYFTGGTALAEYYLKHRLSEDLDFFSFEEIEPLWIVSIAKKLKAVLAADSIDIQESFNRNLVFFTFGKEILKTEFTYFPFTQLIVPREIDEIKVDSIKDLAVNKFFTIYQKPSGRHFIDLYLILKNYHFDWDELSKLARLKFDTAIDPIQLGSQLVTAQDIQDLPRMLIDLPEDEWRNFFIVKAKELKKEINT